MRFDVAGFVPCWQHSSLTAAGALAVMLTVSMVATAIKFLRRAPTATAPTALDSPSGLETAFVTAPRMLPPSAGPTSTAPCCRLTMATVHARIAVGTMWTAVYWPGKLATVRATANWRAPRGTATVATATALATARIAPG